MNYKTLLQIIKQFLVHVFAAISVRGEGIQFTWQRFFITFVVKSKKVCFKHDLQATLSANKKKKKMPVLFSHLNMCQNKLYQLSLHLF